MLGLNKTSGKVSDAAEIRIGWRLIGQGTTAMYCTLYSVESHICMSNAQMHKLISMPKYLVNNVMKYLSPCMKCITVHHVSYYVVLICTCSK